MKKILILAIFLEITFSSFSQNLQQVMLSQNGSKATFSFIADQTVIINVSPDGQVIEWGVDYGVGRLYYYPGKLDKYMGRIELYGPSDNAAFRGKLRYIGATAITYFTADENTLLAGKVKSIGSSMIDYYQQYDDEMLRGKIKTAGNVSLAYFSSFENASLKGKLKSVSNTNISYYSSFDDKAMIGKIKNIGQFNFTYFSSFDSRMPGALKTGFQTQTINNIKFIVWG